MKILAIVAALLLTTGCAAENCFKVSGSGVDLSIGCSKEMQPITEGMER